MGDFDGGNFAPKAARKRKMTKEDHIYGIFNWNEPTAAEEPFSERLAKPMAFTKGSSLLESDAAGDNDTKPDQTAYERPSFTSFAADDAGGALPGVPMGFGKQRMKPPRRAADDPEMAMGGSSEPGLSHPLQDGIPRRGTG